MTLPRAAPTAFFSYAREDSDFARRLATDLKNAGAAVWLDQVDIQPGQRWDSAVEEALTNCGRVLVVLTPAAVKSTNVMDEVAFALDEHKTVIPIVYRDCAIPFRLRRLQRLDFRPDYTRALNDLVRALVSGTGTAVLQPPVAVGRGDTAGGSPKQQERALEQPASDGATPATAEHSRYDARQRQPELAREENERAQAAEKERLTGEPRLAGERMQRDDRQRQTSGTSGSSRGLLIGVDPATLEPGDVFKDADAPWCPEMVVIPSGSFMMGSVEGEQDAYPEESPQHLVTIGYRFAIGRYLVTFAEFEAFCAAMSRPTPGDEGWPRGRFPVINVSWNDAQAFVAWLSQKTNRTYRLPTEAEWEYACRAGTTSRTYRGDSISVKHANYRHEQGRTTEVGSYPANPWGLYDMLGNVWEHVEDPYHDNYVGAPVDGSAWLSGADLSRRVVRGGSFSYGPKDNRSAVRCDHDVATPDRQHGFRVALTI